MNDFLEERKYIMQKITMFIENDEEIKNANSFIPTSIVKEQKLSNNVSDASDTLGETKNFLKNIHMITDLSTVVVDETNDPVLILQDKNDNTLRIPLNKPKLGYAFTWLK